MSDNVNYLPSPDPSAVPIAADNIGGLFHQRVKIGVGGDGAAADVSDQNPMPVADLTLALIGEAAQSATVNNILESVAGAGGTAVDRFRAGSVQVVSTGTAGNFIFEQSNDNINWVTLPVWSGATATASAIVATITANVSSTIYTFPVRARFIRLRIATTITGGSIQAFTRLSTESYAPLPINATLVASSVRAGFVANAGIWYDDTSTALLAGVTFAGTSRDAAAAVTGAAFSSASSYAEEVRACAESDVAGTLWLEISRDNANWRRVRSVATSAITGGGQVAELTYQPAWRYWRIGFTNGGINQARLAVGTIALAA